MMKHLRPFPGNSGKQTRYGINPQALYLLCLTILFLAGFSPKAQAQCSLLIQKVDVSGCYLVGGQSKATVSVEIGWTNAPSGESIEVTLDGQVRTIKPGLITVVYPQVPGNPDRIGTTTIVTPQVVAFEVDADGSSNNLVEVSFENTTSCSVTATYNVPSACTVQLCDGTHLGGIVYKDFNDDGIRAPGETAGVGDVLVTATACDGTVFTATTDGFGNYLMPIPTDKYPVRVEFSNIPSVYNLGVSGTDSRTSVQFVNAPDCGVDLGIINPIDFCSDQNLNVFVPCFTYGDPLVVGSSSYDSDALVTIPYGVSSLTFEGEAPIAKASEVGTIWGLAYNKYTRKLFQSATLKRHAGLGPLGLGGLYVTDYSIPAAPTTSPFLNVKDDLGIEIGSIDSNSDRGLVGDRTQPSRDSQSFAEIGKIGIGDLDISDDGNKLWFVNMNNKKLYSIDISQYNTDGITKPTLTNVDSMAIPATCVGGEYRPWALKVYNGKVYVGGVCDAQTSGNKSDLRATVYELDGNSFTQIFDFPLTYPKGYPAAGSINITGWYPWTDVFADLLDGSRTLRHPVPMFTDIEFDIDGSMVLGFGDRTGWQGGDQNYRPYVTTTTLYETNSQAGDVLRAYNSNGTFVLENNAKAGPNTGYGVNNSQGPGFGEFYNDDWIQENGTVVYHAEEVMGGLALKPGSGSVVVTTIDPVDRHPFAGGVRYMDNTTGLVTGAYAVYITRGPDGNQNPGTFAKATGLGDIELSCSTIELIEIGNRVWVDTDKNGVQDACEKALKDVSVALYKNNSLIATTKTNADGEYLFRSQASLIGGTWVGTDADSVLLPNTKYTVVYGVNGQFADDTLRVDGVGKFILTVQNSTDDGGNDRIDSDAFMFSIAGGMYPVDTVTTGVFGTVNHTLDAGFYCVFPSAETVVATPATCDLNTSNDDGKIKITSIVCADKFAFSKGATFTGPSYAAATVLDGDSLLISDLANPEAAQDTFMVRLYNGECCYKDVLVILPRKECVTGSLGDLVWKDLNDNGQQDDGEPGVNGVKVILWSAVGGAPGAKLDSTTTAGNGAYSFTNLLAGDYIVQIDVTTLPDSCLISSKKNEGGDDEKDNDFTTEGLSEVVTLDPTLTGLNKDNPTIDAGLISPKGSLGDFVWKDLNDNGQQDDGEPGVNGVKVILWSAVGGAPDAKLDSTTTDGSGAYSFTNLLAGDYIVQLDVTTLPDSCLISSKQNEGGDDEKDNDFSTEGLSDVVTLDPTLTGLNKDNPTIDAGLISPKGSLGDFVWKDLNDNGQQDDGEPGVNGVKVILWSAVGGAPGAKLDSTTTAGNGAYSFTNLLAGDYIVQIDVTTLPDSCLISPKQNVGDDASDNDFTTAGLSPVVSLDPTLTGLNKDNPTIDAGLISPKGSLGDFVWKDLNDNGQQDAGEPGVNGVKIILWSAIGGAPNSKLDSTTTAGNGAYSFTNLLAGDYIVQIDVTTLPDSCLISSKQNEGGDETKDNDFTTEGLSEVVSLDPTLTGLDKDNPTIDAGLYSPCVQPVVASIDPVAASCDGKTANTDASFSVSGIVGGNRYTYATSLAGLSTYAAATSLNGASFTINGLPNPGSASGQEYIVRIFNGKDDCFTDITLTIPFRDCSEVCVKPAAGADVFVCKPETTTDLPDAAAGEEWISTALNPVGVSIDAQTGIVSGLNESGVYMFILRDAALGSTCSDTVFVFRGVLELPNQTTCFDTLTLPSVAGATWTVAAGNLATITADGKITGMAVEDMSYAFIVSNGQCSDTILVQRLNCDKIYDLALDKAIDKKLAMLGDTVTYTIRVWNEGEGTVHGIEVTDSLSAGVQYLSSMADIGTYSQLTKKWSFDSLAVGDTASLQISVKIIAAGVWFNTAEITDMTEEDVDSTPGNGDETEDDIDRECFTVPILLCRGQGSALVLNVPQEYSGVVWFRQEQGGQPVQVAIGNSYTASETELGSYEYTFTSTSGTCPAEGCCPVVVVVEDCCPAEVCVPFVITRKVK
ncbi:SdrD B-like domain-containing protein [Arundinibacter roseus]|uniref:DUF11 domain-containing protein n=1 Tax=Arundinibacter roseus TaxID=2070510 RepID=A0A4R4KKW5_9BACT|nr:SdrD B-like domain-containing protein [Arundinibacter roseus]TDB67309.1 DUF11 domain-containing protein [Arundinibacter roseus]